MSFWDATGYLASALVIAAFGMKAMIPLPMNVWRLWQAL
jgi:hypothetical protein